MPSLGVNPDLSFQGSACRVLYLLFRKHSFPSRLHWEPTVHKSVPKPTAPTFLTPIRARDVVDGVDMVDKVSVAQAFQPVRTLHPQMNADGR